MKGVIQKMDGACEREAGRDVCDDGVSLGLNRDNPGRIRSTALSGAALSRLHTAKRALNSACSALEETV